MRLAGKKKKQTLQQTLKRNVNSTHIQANTVEVTVIGLIWIWIALTCLANCSSQCSTCGMFQKCDISAAGSVARLQPDPTAAIFALFRNCY